MDAYGRTNQIAEIIGSTTNLSTLRYDLSGLLTNMVDSVGSSTEFAYNNLGEMVGMADPNLGTWFYSRDFAGRLKLQTDSSGNQTLFDYTDSLGRLKAKYVYDRNNQLKLSVTNNYDTADANHPTFTVFKGQLAATYDNEGREAFSYDVRGRVLKTARYLGKNGQTYTSEQTFDDASRLSSLKYPSSLLLVTNRFDTGGNLTSVQQVGGSNTLFFKAVSFDALGRMLRADFGNGVVTSNLFFPNSRRQQRLVSAKTGSGTNLQDLTYTYDKVSNVKSITDAVITTGAGSATVSSLNYDALHRLTSLTHPSQGTKSFGYTAVGNLATNGEATVSAYTYYGNPGTTTNTFPHAVRTGNGKSYAYDAGGNMTVRGTQTLQYDAENRLVVVFSGTQAAARFGYSGNSARLWKQSGTNALQLWVGSHYEERDGLQLCHVFAGTRRVCSLDKIALTSGGTNEVFHYVHGDHLGSTSLLTDRTGHQVERTVYSGFGREWNVNSTGSKRLSRRYTGQVLDDDTGLYYYGARYYDPELARFIQPDSIIPDLGNPQSWNRYSYTLNNPLRYTDPTGHEPADWANFNQPYLDTYFNSFTQDPSRTSTLTLFSAYMGQGFATGINDLLRFGTGVEQGGTEGWSADLQRFGGLILMGTGAAPRSGGAVAKTVANEANVAAEAGTKATAGASQGGMQIRVNPRAGELGGVNISGANAAKAPKKSNLNSNDATSNFGIYEIEVNGGLHKVGKADLNRVTKSSGLPTRLHQQVRKLSKAHGKDNVQARVVENLGSTTTAAAKTAENARIKGIMNETGSVPVGNQKSYKQ